MEPNEVKVDILSVYYDLIEALPYYIKSVEMNREHIENAIVVCDGKFSEFELGAFLNEWPGEVSLSPDEITRSAYEEDWPTLLLMELDEKPEGSFRVAEALNMGFHNAPSEYVHTVSFDSVMQPGCIEIEKQFAAPRKVLVGAMHHLDPAETDVSQFPDNVIIARPDWKPSLHQMFDRAGRQWLYCHNSHNLWHRDSVLALGGFCTDADKYGRTCEDHEFAARWLYEYGPRSIFFGPTYSWNLSDRTVDSEREGVDAVKRPTIQSREILARTLGKLYDQQYYLFSDTENQPVYSHVQCLPENMAAITDVRVSCTDLSWMPEGEVKDIIAIVGHQYTPGDCIKGMVEGMHRALRPWGRIKLLFPADPIPGSEREHWEAAVEAVGFEIEQLPDQVLVACKVVEED
jgi:SAM-dependent methyltransferase